VTTKTNIVLGRKKKKKKRSALGLASIQLYAMTTALNKKESSRNAKETSFLEGRLRDMPEALAVVAAVET